MSYESEVLADTPQVYWRMGEAAGSGTAQDATANDRDGTYSGTYLLGVPGLVLTSADTAMQVTDPAGGYIRISGASWMTTNVLTAEVWAQRNGNAHDGNASGNLMSRDRTSASFSLRSWYLHWNDDGTITFRAFGGSSARFTLTSPAISNSRHHIVATYDGANARIYVDGAQVASVAATGTLNSNNDLDVGRNATAAADGLRYFNGTLDEAAFYTSALSAARILAHYTASGGAGSLITLAGSAPQPTAAMSLDLPNIVTLAGSVVPTASFVVEVPALVTLDGAAPAPTAAMSLGVAWDVTLDGVAPAPTAAMTIAFGQGIELAGAAPQPEAAMDVLVSLTVTLAGACPAPTADMQLVTDRNITLAGVAPRPTSTFTLVTIREMTLTGVAPQPESFFDIGVEAYITLAGAAPRPEAALTLAFPPSTDTTNRVGGRSRSGIGVATWDPPVVPMPDEFDAGAAVVVAQSFTPPTMDGTQPIYTTTLGRKPRHLDRLVISGRDVTYFRGVPTPFPGYQLTEPLMYGPTTITFPQIAASFEQVGVGALSWLRNGARVTIQRVDRDTLAVVATDYEGIVLGFDADGGALTVQVGGEAQGRAALANRQVPIWTSMQDVGRYAYSALKEIGLRLTPYLGPETGVRMQRFGGQSMLDYISELLARTWNRQGNQYTIMPVAGSRGVYAMSRKNTTTIHGTAYADDARVVASMHRDMAEEPNRIFMTGVTPAGQRVRFGVYPGLKQSPPAPYPFDDGRDFGVGTTDGATDTGDGITVMINRLIVTKYLDQEDRPNGYTQQTRRAIMALQTDAGASFTSGTMDEETWRALYDLGVTGFSLRWSHIEPAAERSYVRKWRRSASGAIMGRNPSYNPAAPKVDVNLDAGPGFTRDQMREFARAELDTEDNWLGSISFPTGALVIGDHDPGDTLTDADVLLARDLRPGMNLSLPLFQGGIVVHVAAVNVGAGDGLVSVDVDTRARDAMKVWEIIARNRESRNNPARAWARDRRSSTTTKDSMGIWDEVGGLLGDAVHLPQNAWTVFPVVAGQEGTVRSLRVRTSPAAQYVMAVFGDTIYASRLQRLIGNPLTHAGKLRWADEEVRDQLDEQNVLLYVAGDKQEPCGYYPLAKHVEDDPDTPATEDGINPLTGRWEDDAGFSYHTREHPVLWVAVFADRISNIPAGRIMWNQLEAGV